VLLAALVAACTAAAEPENAFPYFTEEGGRVRDAAEILSPQAEAQLTQILDRAEAQFGQQMGVVTVESLHGYEIDDFSLLYANAWRLGHSERNDGLMIMVAPNERKVRIEVGLGLEESFTDEYCQQVLDDIMLPAFGDGNLEAAVMAGTEELVQHMQRHPSLPANDNTAPANELEDAA